MEPDINIVLERISISLRNTEMSLSKLINDSEEVEARVMGLERTLEISNHTVKSLVERDWAHMISDIKSINDKLHIQLTNQERCKHDIQLVSQQVNFLAKVYDEKVNKLETKADENQVALWKLLAGGAGSGAVVTGLIQLIHTLVT